MPRYQCSYCEKNFVGDYGLGAFPLCSDECRKLWGERFERNLLAFVELDKRREALREKDGEVTPKHGA